jgi:hypothetical protein
MKLEAIFELWNEDSKINRNELGEEALKISSLHQKYYKIFVHERLVQKKLETDLKRLKLEKHEFYTQGPTPEQSEKGWKLPSIGRIIKSDVSTYLDADEDIINLTLKIAAQSEKVDLLESIIRTLRDRNFNIRAAIDWSRFQVGA